MPNTLHTSNIQCLLSVCENFWYFYISAKNMIQDIRFLQVLKEYKVNPVKQIKSLILCNTW